MSDETAEPRGERLVEAALERDALRRARLRARLSPADQQEVLAVEAFFADCRELLASDARAEHERPLVERVLARTTRRGERRRATLRRVADSPGWAGDLRVVGGWVGERLRTSRATRWAAASLLLHVVALPGLAWYAGQSSPRYVIRFEPPPAAVSQELPGEAELRVVAPEVPSGPSAVREVRLPPHAGAAGDADEDGSAPGEPAEELGPVDLDDPFRGELGDGW